MYNKQAYPKKQQGMVTYAVTVIKYVTDPVTFKRLGIIQTKLDTATTNVGTLSTDWAKNGDPSTHTTIVTEQIQKDIELVKENLTDLFSDIKEEVYTVTDRQIFCMSERAKGSPIPVADYCPVFLIKAVGYLLLKLRFINSATPNSRAMPKGNKIFFEYYIGVAGLTPGNIPFANGTNITKAFYTLQFLDTDIGKTVYMRCYYENNRGQRSPVSATISKLIA